MLTGDGGVCWLNALGVWSSAIDMLLPTGMGPCSAGYYCPEGSTRPDAVACGNVTVYCPQGAVGPLVTAPGWFSDGGTSDATRARQTPCVAGQHCIGGVSRPCDGGFYGTSPALSVSTCSGPCPAGYYCPSGTVTPVVCGSVAVYCPARSAGPTTVSPGYYSIGGAGVDTRSGQRCGAWLC